MNLCGTFDVTIKSPLGEERRTLTIETAAGSGFTGTSSGVSGSAAISGTLEGNRLAWQEQVKVPMPLTLDIIAVIQGDTLSGSVKAGMFGSFPMTGMRAG